ncbi:hypothetical protein GGR25_000555 [Kaistia hirudinis]|uniref:Uncharacterized protein n=1 Tax=Kaistia hirudinis TaxID=1293440 RepID=A0A840AM61_9HYPH|nr:hypothetical protein [Kaistia hirudinis]MBB3929536.1 hypothetical protein [Kaistia hirudinis]
MSGIGFAALLREAVFGRLPRLRGAAGADMSADGSEVSSITRTSFCNRHPARPEEPVAQAAIAPRMSETYKPRKQQFAQKISSFDAYNSNG